MKHDHTPGSQNCKIGSGQESKMADITKNSKNIKISFSRITEYFWRNLGIEFLRNVGIQNCKIEKNLWRSFIPVTYFLFTSVILLQFVCLKMTYLNNFKHFFSETIPPIVVKVHMKHDQTQGFQNYRIVSGQESKVATNTKNSKNNQINFSRTIRYNWL